MDRRPTQQVDVLAYHGLSKEDLRDPGTTSSIKVWSVQSICPVTRLGQDGVGVCERVVALQSAIAGGALCQQEDSYIKACIRARLQSRWPWHSLRLLLV